MASRGSRTVEARSSESPELEIGRGRPAGTIRGGAFGGGTRTRTFRLSERAMELVSARTVSGATGRVRNI